VRELDVGRDERAGAALLAVARDLERDSAARDDDGVLARPPDELAVVVVERDNRRCAAERLARGHVWPRRRQRIRAVEAADADVDRDGVGRWVRSKVENPGNADQADAQEAHKVEGGRSHCLRVQDILQRRIIKSARKEETRKRGGKKRGKEQSQMRTEGTEWKCRCW